MPHPINLTASLRTALPQNLHGYIDPIVKLLSLLTPPSENTDNTRAEELQIQVNPVSLGNENSYGDVSLSDIAGGNRVYLDLRRKVSLFGFLKPLRSLI